MTYKLVIADMDTGFTQDFARYLSRFPEFRIVGIANDGTSALSITLNKQPDILLTDMLLPGMDGICLLKKIQKMSNPPIVICISDFCSRSSIESARNNGASYYVIKPIEFSDLLSILREHIHLISESSKHLNNRSKAVEGSVFTSSVYKIIHSLGFSSKYIGSSYIAESAILAIESPLILRNLSKGLYQELSFRLKTKPSCIERCMRTAISAANESGHLEHILGETPTNKRCIQYILNELKSQPKS